MVNQPAQQCLLDTHAFMWACLEPERLSPRVTGMLESGGYRPVLSTAVCWEMVIKEAKGVWTFPGGPKAATRVAERWAKMLNAAWLPVEISDMEYLEQLPPIHKDPFDRIMIAQAWRLNLGLLTNDEKIHKYPVAAGKSLVSGHQFEAIW